MFSHIQVAAIVTFGTGRPVDPLTGLDSNHGHAFPLSVRPLGLGRNALRTPGLASTDLRVLKYFPFGRSARLDLVAEAFNLFNHPNILKINPVFGSNLAPQASRASPSRERVPAESSFPWILSFERQNKVSGSRRPEPFESRAAHVSPTTRGATDSSGDGLGRLLPSSWPAPSPCTESSRSGC